MEYEALLERYSSGPERLRESLARFSAEEMERVPARPGAWSAAEHVIHLADSEANGLVRAKSIVGQPNSTVYVMDEEAWTAGLRAVKEDWTKYLSLFSSLRLVIGSFAAAVPVALRERDHYVWTYGGNTKEVTLAGAIEIYANHLDFHLEYLDKLRKEFDAS